MHQIPHRQFATKFVTKFSYKKTRTLTNDSYNTAFYYPPPLKKNTKGLPTTQNSLHDHKTIFFFLIYFLRSTNPDQNITKIMKTNSQSYESNQKSCQTIEHDNQTTVIKDLLKFLYST